MTTYRTLLQAGAHPPVDPRRAAALRARLRRLASVLTPQWTPTDAPDDFGSALLAIAGRLGEETTRRLDQTAERDALAFFDLLGLPPMPPHAAKGVLVLALAEGAILPIDAPARTQVAVATTGGDDVTFETRSALRVVPGRLADLIAVDPADDRIELAPAQVTALERPAAVPETYAVVSPAGAGSQTLQLSPAVGLAPQDVLRIEAAAHRIATVEKNTGIVTLQDPLDAPVAAGATVRRIASFPSFTLRNLQHHVLYVGHSALFDLKQRAKISLVITPPRLARELTRGDVAFAMWGTKDGEPAPDWHPLVVRGTCGGAVELVKPDPGTVDPRKIDGRDGRWLRAELRGPVSRLRALSSPAAEISIAVASPEPTDQEPAEGSRTVARAFYNGTPLSTAGRFLPFGPEPVRFDTLALAAPEALSKRGATVTVTITMVDSSLATFEIAAVADPATVRGYGAGANGGLEVLAFRDDGRLRWHALEATENGGRRLLLAGAAAVETATAGTDLVVAVDRDGNLWSARVKRSPEQVPSVEGPCRPLFTPPSSADSARRPNGRPPGPVLAPAPAGSGVAAVLFCVAEGELFALRVDDTGAEVGTEWQRVDGTGSPTLTGASQVTPVQGPDWPQRPDRLELVAIDPKGAVWLASITPVDITSRLAATWVRLEPTGSSVPAADTVAPAATRFRGVNGSDRLWVAYATAAGRPHGLLRTGTGVPKQVPLAGLVGATVSSESAMHADPGTLGADGRPVTVALGPTGPFLWPAADKLVTTQPPPGQTRTGRPILLRTGPDRGAEVVLGGTDERLFRAALVPATVAYTLHNSVAPQSSLDANWVAIGDPPTWVELVKEIRRVGKGELNVYQIDSPVLVPGMPLTFLRYDDQDATHRGSFLDPANRTALQLATRDSDTRPGHWLIIRGIGYLVKDRVGRMATLATAVAGTAKRPTYRPATELGSVGGATAVRTTDLATLAELATTDAAVPALHFGLAADPAEQPVRMTSKAATSVWALLATAWTTPPPSEGRVTIPGTVTDRPSWTESALERGYQNPELSWEYYDGEGWRRLERRFVDGTANLASTGDVVFVVPDDLAPTEIGGKTDLWIRARLVGGDYGRPNYVVRTTPAPPDTVQTVTVDSSNMHPPEILALEATFVLNEQRAPEILLVENNLDVVDQTQAATVPEARFDLFTGAVAAAGTDRALFVGLTGPTGVGSLSLLVDALDQEGTGSLAVDLRTAGGWHRVPVDDRTESLRRRGLVTISIDVEPVTIRLFGRERAWLRLRPSAGTGPWAPEVRGLYLNAVEISQARTVGNEILGSSLGEPGLTVALAEVPVLPDTVRLRVRERVSDEERATLEAAQKAAAESGQEPPDPVVVAGLEQVPGTWVLWRRVDSLLGQDADARVYVLDPASGRVTFGDGRTGRIPSAGRDCIRAFGYQQGGGVAGNVAAWAEATLTSAVEGVDTVVLPVDAAGGFGGTGTPEADQAARDSLLATAPDLLRHAGRALSPADIEALAVASAPDVVRAHCAGPTGPRAPITVALSVRDGTRRPVPTLARRDALAAFLRESGWGGLRPGAIVVTAPTYVGVAVTVRLVAARGFLADVEQAAKTVLARLFHPAEGGPDGTGWPFGRPPTDSDVLRALGTVDSLDRVESVELTPTGDRPLSALPVDGQVYAETTDVTVVVTAAEGAT